MVALVVAEMLLRPTFFEFVLNSRYTDWDHKYFLKTGKRMLDLLKIVRRLLVVTVSNASGQIDLIRACQLQHVTRARFDFLT